MRTYQKRTVDPDNDEYYTLRETADAVAAYVKRFVSLDAPIDCPADTYDSEIPNALARAGFTDVEFYQDLPTLDNNSSVREAAVIVTNPPFSLRRWFSAYLLANPQHRFVVCSTLADFPTYGGASIPELSRHKNFLRPNGKVEGVAVTWVTNFGDARIPDVKRLYGKALGVCCQCERGSCALEHTDTYLYSIHAAARAGGVFSYCNRYTVNGKVSFGRAFLTKGLPQTTREKERRLCSYQENCHLKRLSE